MNNGRIHLALLAFALMHATIALPAAEVNMSAADMKAERGSIVVTPQLWHYLKGIGETQKFATAVGLELNQDGDPKERVVTHATFNKYWDQMYTRHHGKAKTVKMMQEKNRNLRNKWDMTISIYEDFMAAMIAVNSPAAKGRRSHPHIRERADQVMPVESVATAVCLTEAQLSSSLGDHLKGLIGKKRYDKIAADAKRGPVMISKSDFANESGTLWEALVQICMNSEKLKPVHLKPRLEPKSKKSQSKEEVEEIPVFKEVYQKLRDNPLFKKYFQDELQRLDDEFKFKKSANLLFTNLTSPRTIEALQIVTTETESFALSMMNPQAECAKKLVPSVDPKDEGTYTFLIPKELYETLRKSLIFNAYFKEKINDLDNLVACNDMITLTLDNMNDARTKFMYKIIDEARCFHIAESLKAIAANKAHKPADVKVKTPEGEIELFMNNLQNRLEDEAAHLLIQSLNAQDHDKSLEIAARWNNLNANFQSPQDNNLTLLMHAARCGNFDVVESLIERKADIELTDANGKNVLDYVNEQPQSAAQRDTARLLVKNFSRINREKAQKQPAASDRGESSPEEKSSPSQKLLAQRAAERECAEKWAALKEALNTAPQTLTREQLDELAKRIGSLSHQEQLKLFARRPDLRERPVPGKLAQQTPAAQAAKERPTAANHQKSNARHSASRRSGKQKNKHSHQLPPNLAALQSYLPAQAYESVGYRHAIADALAATPAQTAPLAGTQLPRKPSVDDGGSPVAQNEQDCAQEGKESQPVKLPRQLLLADNTNLLLAKVMRDHHLCPEEETKKSLAGLISKKQYNGCYRLGSKTMFPSIPLDTLVAQVTQGFDNDIVRFEEKQMADGTYREIFETTITNPEINDLQYNQIPVRFVIAKDGPNRKIISVYPLQNKFLN